MKASSPLGSCRGLTPSCRMWSSSSSESLLESWLPPPILLPIVLGRLALDLTAGRRAGEAGAGAGGATKPSTLLPASLGRYDIRLPTWLRAETSWLLSAVSRRLSEVRESCSEGMAGELGVTILTVRADSGAPVADKAWRCVGSGEGSAALCGGLSSSARVLDSSVKSAA